MNTISYIDHRSSSESESDEFSEDDKQRSKSVDIAPKSRLNSMQPVIPLIQRPIVVRKPKDIFLPKVNRYRYYVCCIYYYYY